MKRYRCKGRVRDRCAKACSKLRISSKRRMVGENSSRRCLPVKFVNSFGTILRKNLLNFVGRIERVFKFCVLLPGIDYIKYVSVHKF